MVVLALTVVIAGWLAIQLASPAVAWYDGRGDKIPGLERAVAWHPQNAELRIKLGHAYADKVPADFTRARAQYSEAVRLRPTDAYPRLLRALLAEKEGDHAAARAAIEGAVQLDPHNVSIRWEAAATHAVAVGGGAWWARRRLAWLSQTLRGPTRALAALAVYALLLVLWGVRPFLPQTEIGAIAEQLTAAHLVPLASLAQRVDVFSALHVAQQFLLFLPVGCLLAVWPLRLRGRWSHLWPAVWLAAGIEVGHLVIADRYFDLTNALIACAGLGIGWLALRRSGFAPYGEALAPLRP